MALREFWYSVGAAARQVSDRFEAPVSAIGGTQQDPALARADLWLISAALQGFDPADFAFLAEEELPDLTDAVNQFRAVAQQVSRRSPATLDQVEQARAQFDRILAILRFEKYSDLDAFVLGKRLERAVNATGERPDWVQDFVFETGQDSLGEQAIWIWLLVDDAILDGDHPFAKVRDTKDLVENCLRRLATDYWPFIRFRTVSEQRELVG